MHKIKELCFFSEQNTTKNENKIMIFKMTSILMTKKFEDLLLNLPEYSHLKNEKDNENFYLAAKFSVNYNIDDFYMVQYSLSWGDTRPRA
ncbi:hypothetical protein M153_9000024444 [Pseudoloma neurophilia]|uniref:Uncharacterized protein n=1 Tax=Pseudoloma neurophilia TaxID=146866 RepID=A0A0R0M0D9_9MICR|nr:hypothetical protein M153_9000024444 [Pseudoloma neurophilia]